MSIVQNCKAPFGSPSLTTLPTCTTPCSVVLPTPFRDAALQAGGTVAATAQQLLAKRAGGVLRDKHGALSSHVDLRDS